MGDLIEKPVIDYVLLYIYYDPSIALRPEVALYNKLTKLLQTYPTGWGVNLKTEYFINNYTSVFEFTNGFSTIIIDELNNSKAAIIEKSHNNDFPYKFNIIDCKEIELIIDPSFPKKEIKEIIPTIELLPKEDIFKLKISHNKNILKF